MAPKNSTTPKADKERALFAEYDKNCRFITVPNEIMGRAKCKNCNQRFRYVMSSYAVSKGPDEFLTHCGCNPSLVWIKVTY